MYLGQLAWCGADTGLRVIGLQLCLHQSRQERRTGAARWQVFTVWSNISVLLSNAISFCGTTGAVSINFINLFGASRRINELLGFV